MINNNHIDIGENMTYCPKHKCWWQFGEDCIDCVKEQLTKSIKIENEMSI